MSRIDLRGVIVPSEYDAEWASPFIAKGIITPESSFRAMLAAAAKGEPLTVYVNSPGGSVFSANEMVNAVREWKAETKQPVNVVLGALTASAASAFAIMAADDIQAHANAKMMFHGAWTVSIGGKELHADTAGLLGKINADIKTRLVSKYGLAPETVTEWFAEGREGWLSAQELVDAKLASAIIADPSDVLDFPADAMGEIEKRGLGIAAFLKNQVDAGLADEKQETKDVRGKTDDHPATGGGDPSGDAGGSHGPDADGKPGAVADPTGADYQAGLAAGRTEQAAADAERIEAATKLARQLQGDRDRARAEVAKLTSDIEAVKVEATRRMEASTVAYAEAMKKTEAEHAAIVADMRKKLSEAQQKCERLVSGGMTFSPDTADKAGRTASDVDPRGRLHPALR
jgi:ATP-dependent Clp protease protease subunit